MGADYMDYLIGDRIVTPEEQRSYYTRKIVYLPNSYLPLTQARNYGIHSRDLGLPPTGFIFCCFNNNYKIMPHTFEQWMRVANRVENSVL